MRLGYCLFAMLVIGGCASSPETPLRTAESYEPEVVRTLELRKRYGLPVPNASTIIYVDSVAVHHTYNEASTIVWRDETGVWRWSQAREVGPGGLFPVERKLEHFKEAELSLPEGGLLDQIVGKPALYGDKIATSGQTGIGAPFHVMSIVSPHGRVTIRWSARLLGDAGSIADIALGHS
ncbi:hypothetical protein [Sphingopyxis panaciterrae]